MFYDLYIHIEPHQLYMHVRDLYSLIFILSWSNDQYWKDSYSILYCLVLDFQRVDLKRANELKDAFFAFFSYNFPVQTYQSHCRKVSRKILCHIYVYLWPVWWNNRLNSNCDELNSANLVDSPGNMGTFPWQNCISVTNIVKLEIN